MNNQLLADLPPPPPFSLFSGDPPYVAASIAIILFGFAASTAVVWLLMRSNRSRKAAPIVTKKN